MSSREGHHLLGQSLRFFFPLFAALLDISLFRVRGKVRVGLGVRVMVQC